ncbi:hypothetical protein QNI19_06850 [Cytophagaceae bacterium DM2B3-1]|uniref:Phosphate ABC transporter substrate-binding protein n=1 Tax=Xanthocytophaga flava TaxID=3048013 RepID=A0AAE3QKS1_9BACT|nr:hypothetical protein [Xanthocytophaga flavus]MDJ1466648.1 hypothetical protein [Xanthocytophaga flavus]MDJ1479300.1 hypothetical protein [Xanthocytophaga flavus]MDJ1492644.1 hypothetical protein [Xanthocytophaga flavus]
MKVNKKFKDAFGCDETGFIALPIKFSNVRISRIENCDDMGGCSFCFPHGFESTNAKESKYQRNWKKFRRTQWKHE